MDFVILFDIVVYFLGREFRGCGSVCVNRGRGEDEDRRLFIFLKRMIFVLVKLMLEDLGS